MPFPPEVREDALARSRRYCCVCHQFHGRDVTAHHIVQEADGGPNTIDNAIVLCFKCHSEAGHYNPRHPLGAKYSPSELVRHRDEWWRYCQTYEDSLRPPDAEPIGFDGHELIEKEIGTLWSHFANQPASIEVVRFNGKLIGKRSQEDRSGTTWEELYQVSQDRYLVYTVHNHCCDWCVANVTGIDEPNGDPTPMPLWVIQRDHPELATASNLSPSRTYTF